MDERFGLMEQRFGLVDRRFGAVDKRFEDLATHMNSRFTRLMWMIGIGFVVIMLLTTVFAPLA